MARRPASVAAFDTAVPQGFAGTAALTGPHRCPTCEFLVVSDLAALHNEAKVAGDSDAFTYLVLRS